MKTILKAAALGTIFCLLFVCSCATKPQATAVVPATDLPADVTMNKDAGRGGMVFVMLRLGSGEELSFVMDSGAGGTCLAQSLEPKLGKRLDTDTGWQFGKKYKVGVYAAPKIYFGGTQLMTGTNVYIFDWGKMSDKAGRPVMGILGMDVLKHYCIQLDFAAGKICFLDDEHADKNDWGKPFPMAELDDGCFFISENLFGAKGSPSLIDTGWDDGDGWLAPKLFKQWTNRAALPSSGEVRSPNAMLGGEIYPDVVLHEFNPKSLSSDDQHIKFNGIGLHFLSRHLVTLDFPKRTMYLKRISVGPLAGKNMEQNFIP
jgi:hypothetical protein